MPLVYQIPTTWDELHRLVRPDRRRWRQRRGAWASRFGAATGWPATDWMEEFMLRTTTPENYDKWVKGELKFDSPEVREALQKLSDLWLKEGYVYGGQEAITTTFFGDAPAPMFEQPAEMLAAQAGQLHHRLLPRGCAVWRGLRLLLPAGDRSRSYGDPYLVAGDIYAMWRDAPEVQAVYEYFTKGESLKEWLAAGGALAPQNDTCLDWYTDPMEQKIAGLVQECLHRALRRF